MSARKLDLLQTSERFILSIGLLASLENISLLCSVGHGFFFSGFHLASFSLTGAPPQGIKWETTFAMQDTDFSF